MSESTHRPSRVERDSPTVPKNRGEILVSGLDVDQSVILLIENAIDADGRPMPPKAVAELLGLDRSVLYDILSGRRRLRANELERVVKLRSRINRYAPLDLIETSVGRVGVPLPTLTGASADAAVMRAEVLIKEFGDLLLEFGLASADRRYTREEAITVREEGQQVIQAVHALINQVEALADPSAEASR